MEEIEIRFNSKKIFFRIVYGFALIGIGFWLLYGDTSLLNRFPRISDPNFKKFMGFLIIGLMTLGVLFLFKCLLTKKPGFVIDESGFTDRTSIFSKGKIYWEDIEYVERNVIKFFINVPSLKVVLKNSSKPKLYSAGLLDVSLDELIKLVTDNFEKKSQNQVSSF
ncbi:STM3941 family protein [Flavobacterium sp. RSB2_4_14]|uniref:STM3941 family protein n=1 Tax=Flavobacterium sp. RSB2_4_14 TaxID=3447665 RepID=UPI003F398AAA